MPGQKWTGPHMPNSEEGKRRKRRRRNKGKRREAAAAADGWHGNSDVCARICPDCGKPVMTGTLSGALKSAATATAKAAAKVAVKAAGAVAKNGPQSAQNLVQKANVALKTGDKNPKQLNDKKNTYSAEEVAKSLENFLQAKDQVTANNRYGETTRLMQKYVEYVVMQNKVQSSFSYDFGWPKTSAQIVV